MNNDKFYSIAGKLDGIFKDVDLYARIFEIDRMQAEEETGLFSAQKDKAALGVKEARDYIIDQYTRIMARHPMFQGDDAVDRLVDFDMPGQNPVGIQFEMLLKIHDISELIDRYHFSVRVTEDQVLEAATLEEKAIRMAFADQRERLAFIALMVYSREYGQDCVDTLQYHNINEIGIIDKDYIYLVYKGRKLHLSFLKMANRNIILNIQKKTTQNSPVNYDGQNPTMVTAKNNSSRITVAGYDSTPTEEDLYYNERIFNLKKITLEEMRDSYGTIDDRIYELLLLNQRGRGSHYVTGSDMGVGKSTFLLSMMEKVPDHWGIGILDTQNELQARKKYPGKNIITLIETPKRTIANCFEVMLKMARDVLIVGEITKPSEVAEQINASLRLNAGVGGTLHSLSPFEVVTNVRNLMMMTGIYKDAELAEADIARGLDLVIHLKKLSGGRIVVDRIVEVVYEDGDMIPEPLLIGSNSAKMSNLLDMAQLALKKYLYRKKYRYNEIFKYDQEGDCWRIVNLPTEAYFHKLSQFVGIHEIKSVKDRLAGKQSLRGFTHEACRVEERMDEFRTRVETAEDYFPDWRGGV